jgi:hypothetical protein
MRRNRIMCRLAFITERFPVKDWLQQLEKSMGGDGNGIAIGKTLIKGVKVTIDKISDIIMNSKEPALFHTRRVSSGIKNDHLCHPFPCRKGFLAHNGHWTDGHNAACVLDDLRFLKEFASDSQVFSFVVDKIGFERAVTKYKPDGVWFFLNKKGKLFVYKNYGVVYYSPEYDAWGSEKSDEGHWYAVEDGYYTPGDTPKEAQWSINFNSNSRSNSDWTSHPYRSTPSLPPYRPAETKQVLIKAKSPVHTIPGLYHVVPSAGEKRQQIEDFNSRNLPEYYQTLDRGIQSPNTTSNQFRKEGNL